MAGIPVKEIDQRAKFVLDEALETCEVLRRAYQYFDEDMKKIDRSWHTKDEETRTKLAAKKSAVIDVMKCIEKAAWDIANERLEFEKQGTK